MFGKVKRKHNIYKTWSCHIPADVRILEWEAMRIFVESVLRFGMSEAKTVFWYFSKRSRKMSTLIILVQRPPSFASFIMSPKALKLVHFCCNHLDEVVPRERDANWKKTQKASWLAHFFLWHNFMEFLIWGYHEIMEKQLPELNEISDLLSSSWVHHRPPLPTCTICCFCPGRHNSCTQSFGWYPWQTGKLCSSKTPRLSFYVSQKLGGCDEHQYVWDRANLKLSVNVSTSFRLKASWLLLTGMFQTT